MTTEPAIPETESETAVAVADAAFLRRLIRENDERWNRLGISEPDMAVMLEMSPNCGWGARYTKGRFNRALRLLAKRSDVAKRGERWFPSTSPTLESLDETGGRLCARPGCGAGISHLRASSRYCSPACRNRAARRRQTSDLALHQSRSGPRESADFRPAGTGGPSVTFGGKIDDPVTAGGASDFQLLPRLDDDARDALRADIAAHGVLVPIVRTADGRIVDGHHRAAIAEELGVACPELVVDVDDQAAAEMALRLNLVRRHMGPVQWAEAFKRLVEARGLRLGRGVRNDRRTASVSDVATSDTVSEVDRPVADVASLAQALGVNARTARRRLRLAERLAGHPEIAAAVDRGDLDARRAEEQVRRANYAARLAEAPPPPVVTLGDGIELRHGDFREVLADIPDQSVDAVVCDPPYTTTGVPLYSDLSKFAARVLKPGRLLVAYTGKVDLPEQLNRLGEHLQYVWTGAVLLPGRHTLMRQHLIRGRWRPVAIFSAGKYVPRHWLLDCFYAPGNGAKGPTDHHWQQPLAPFISWVSQVAEPGELVVDPFLGSGTTALACRAAGRRFLGCDIDPAAVSLARERLTTDTIVVKEA